VFLYVFIVHLYSYFCAALYGIIKNDDKVKIFDVQCDAFMALLIN